jgi:hypothetical protein
VYAAAAVLGLAFVAADSAHAYVGESFLRMPGVSGGWAGGKYKGWVKFEAQYWGEGSALLPGGMQAKRYQAHGLNAGGRVYYSGPVGPREGGGKLSLALDKRSPALQPLMEKCLSKATIPELTYAESSDLSRPSGEWGDRPADIPEFYEYKLKNIQLSCPENADAPEQAFVLSFNNIELTNYKGSGETPTRVRARLPSASSSGETRTFVATFVASATDVGSEKEQCPKMNEGPSEADYYALSSPEDAAKDKAKFASKGGVINTRDGIMFRGPDHLNACQLPGIVRDPGHVSPVSDVARGFDLDGDDGGGPPRPGIHPHKNFVSEDGRKGIDNQLLTIDGCIPGFRRNGLLTAARNELMRSGTISVLLQISGIHGLQHDKGVDVTLLYSLDPMVKNSGGSQILPRYTFRVTEDPELAPDFVRFHGRVENGVVITDPIKVVTLHEGSLDRIVLHEARMRLAFQADGTIKGYIGGYQDWRLLYNFWGRSPHFEQGMGFTCPGMYEAFKRAADGLPDPVSGEFHGVSAAYDIEAVPAFVPPAQQKALAEAGNGYKER